MKSQEFRTTRLGDILVKKGLITDQQLQYAIDAQKTSALPIGEILIENNWVTQWQIKRALRVQSKLRNVVLTSLISLSPLALVGCGSGGGGTEANQNSAVAEQTINASQLNADNTNSSNNDSTEFQTASILSLEESGSSETSPEEAIVTVNNVQETIEPEALNDIQLSWNYPEQRTDGSEFEVFEAQSFKIYRMSDTGEVDSVHQVDGLDTNYKFENLSQGQYHFAITVVDIEGLESELSEAISVSI